MLDNGFIRVAAAVPAVNVADCRANVKSILVQMKEAADAGARVVVMPELTVTGYTCGDLFHTRTLLDASNNALARLAAASRTIPALLVVGAPVDADGRLYNCAVVIGGGKIVGAVPKTYLPTYNEFYERRWFSASEETDKEVSVLGHTFRLNARQLFEIDGVKIGMELCEDMWTPLPPSTQAALAGAQVLLNLSASTDMAGKYHFLKQLVAQQSVRCRAAYVYCSSGYGESTTDVVFDGKIIIAEAGTVLASSSRWNMQPHISVADIDTEAIDRERIQVNTFGDCAAAQGVAYSTVKVDIPQQTRRFTDLLRSVNPMPFIPQGMTLDDVCNEVVSIQTTGLCRRLDFTRCKSLVVGVSGGLDSTLALLVATRAFDRLGIDRKGIIGVTMPGFGTTDRTYTNALTMMRTLGITMREVPIANAVMQHFSDIGHDPAVRDITYENAQARERTQILMDIANETNGMVLGTGDLSELALGWATYNGDHMSMYGVNAGVPKTLVRFLVKWFAENSDNEEERAALLDVIDTPISPELIPAEADGTIRQKTEDLVGPYELHDFFLYYMLRYGFSPRRIFILAQKAFADKFDDRIIARWLSIFMRRFFAQQFKRSCLPDGPKVVSISLSPRGDWRMPSDACADLWITECKEIEAELN